MELDAALMMRVPVVAVQDPSAYETTKLILTNYSFMADKRKFASLSPMGVMNMERDAMERLHAADAFSKLRSTKDRIRFIDNFITSPVFSRSSHSDAEDDNTSFLAAFMSMAAMRDIRFLRMFRMFEIFVFYRRMILSMRLNGCMAPRGGSYSPSVLFEDEPFSDCMPVVGQIYLAALNSGEMQNTDFLGKDETFTGVFGAVACVSYPWTYAEPLVAKRKVLLHSGIAFAHPSWLPVVEMHHVFKQGWNLWVATLRKFDPLLSRTILLGPVDEQSLAEQPAALGMNHLWIRTALRACCRFIAAGSATRHAIANPQKVTDLVPPCIKAIMRKLSTEGDLSYIQRCVLIRYLRDTGHGISQTEETLERNYKSKVNRTKRLRSIEGFYGEKNPREVGCSYLQASGLCVMQTDVPAAELATQYDLELIIARSVVEIPPRGATDKYYPNRRCSHLAVMKGNKRRGIVLTPAQMAMNTEYARAQPEDIANEQE